MLDKINGGRHLFLDKTKLLLYQGFSCINVQCRSFIVIWLPLILPNVFGLPSCKRLKTSRGLIDFSSFKNYEKFIDFSSFI